MAITQATIDDTINKAQQRIATLGNEVATLELKGEMDESKYRVMRYLSGAINVLQSDVDDLTGDNKDDIVNCMIAIGELSQLSATPLSFSALTIVIPPVSIGSYTDLDDTDNTYVNHDSKIPVVDESLNQLVFTKLNIGAQTFVVSPAGDDTRASGGDWVCHYQTIDAAQTDASSGDTILILPGAYTIPDGDQLGKAGVTYNFMDGAVLTSNTTTGNALWEITGAGEVKIQGNGRFIQSAVNEIIRVKATQTFRVRGRFEQTANTDAFVAELNSTLIVDDVQIVLTTVTNKGIAFSAAGGGTDEFVYVYSGFSNQDAHDANIKYRINSLQIDPQVQ